MLSSPAAPPWPSGHPSSIGVDVHRQKVHPALLRPNDEHCLLLWRHGQAQRPDGVVGVEGRRPEIVVDERPVRKCEPAPTADRLMEGDDCAGRRAGRDLAQAALNVPHLEPPKKRTQRGTADTQSMDCRASAEPMRRNPPANEQQRMGLASRQALPSSPLASPQARPPPLAQRPRLHLAAAAYGGDASLPERQQGLDPVCVPFQDQLAHPALAVPHAQRPVVRPAHNKAAGEDSETIHGFGVAAENGDGPPWTQRGMGGGAG